MVFYDTMVVWHQGDFFHRVWNKNDFCTFFYDACFLVNGKTKQEEP